VLLADTTALAGGSSTNDRAYARTEAALTRLGADRDKLVLRIQRTLASAALTSGHERHDSRESNAEVRGEIRAEIAAGQALLARARHLATPSAHGSDH
jgi:hypothetical protein